jgi:nucleoside-diphosphate-sugar epimerase
MRIFLTGATGFIGSAIIPNLLNAGHSVLGLTRSDGGAEKLLAAGVEPHRGDLADLDSLRRGAEQTDATIHCGFTHDFTDFVAICEQDRKAIEAMGDVLVGSSRPFLITSGTGMGNFAPGQPATEDHFDPNPPNPRRASELAGQAAAERGVNVVVVRLPQVHDTVKQGLITYNIAIAREKGFSAYLGEGQNRWPAAHVSDTARLYHLALERAVASPQPNVRYHAVAEAGISNKDIAEAIARGLKIPVRSLTPEEAPAYFGWLAAFAGFDMPASSAWTQKTLDWKPTGPTLLADLGQMDYSKV